MGVVRLRRVSTCFFVVYLLFWLWPFTTYAASGRIYYDSQGNIISAEEYRKLTGQPPEASPQAKKVSEGEALEPEQESALAAPPVAAQPVSPDDAAKGGEVPPASEKEAAQPVSPDAKAQPAVSAADREPAQGKVPAVPPYELTVRSDTLFRAFRRDTELKDDEGVLPLYEYLQIDLNTKEEGLSLHTYGWGRHDLNDSQFYHDNPDGELLYGYIEYQRSDYGLNLKLGRQQVFEGIINSTLDGLGIKSALTPYFNWSLYGGSPVALSSDEGRSGDSFLGGRFAGHLGSRFEIGLSYQLENSDGTEDGEKTGVDFSVSLPGNAYLQGRSAYNLDTGGWGEHFVEGGLNLGDFQFRPTYERYQYDDYFNEEDNSADPFRFLAGTGETLSVLGGDILWHRFGQVDLGAKVMHYSYDLREDDAMYYEGNLTWYLNGLTQIGGQIGRMDGGTSETAYFLTRAFFYWNRPLDAGPLQFVTGDAVHLSYDEEVYGKDSSLFLSLGAGARFFSDSLEVKLSGDYSSDPYFDSDLRGLLTLTYRKTVQSRAGGDLQSRGRK